MDKEAARRMEEYSRKNIPLKFVSILCMCTDSYRLNSSKSRPNYKEPYDIAKCWVCHKPYRWYLWYCVVCKEPFIKDYAGDSIGCSRHPKCWECLGSTDSCCERESSSIQFVHGPLGYNPKKFSQEELDAFDLDAWLNS